MRQFDTACDSPEAIHAALTARDTARDAQVEATVRAILDDVKARGDAAVLDYTRRFDWPGAEIEGLSLSFEQLTEQYWPEVSQEEWNILSLSMTNIMEFHTAERGHLQSWMHLSNSGQARLTGQILQPVNRAGLYIPGGESRLSQHSFNGSDTSTYGWCQGDCYLYPAGSKRRNINLLTCRNHSSRRPLPCGLPCIQNRWGAGHRRNGLRHGNGSQV